MANLDWLGEGLAELTAERLQDRGLTVLSRQERLAALEKIGLPDSARFSHATMVKIAAEADADEVIYGRFVSDGKTVTLEAHVLHINPPSLSPPFTQTSSMQDLLRAHARLSWQMLCALERKNCLPEGANKDESSFSEPPPSLRLDALENFIRGLTGTDDETRLRALREAARLEPAWDRPPFELGQIYFCAARLRIGPALVFTRASQSPGRSRGQLRHRRVPFAAQRCGARGSRIFRPDGTRTERGPEGPASGIGRSAQQPRRRAVAPGEVERGGDGIRTSRGAGRRNPITG